MAATVRIERRGKRDGAKQVVIAANLNRGSTGSIQRIGAIAGCCCELDSASLYRSGEGDSVEPGSLVGQLESVTSLKREAWTTPIVRAFCDVLLDVSEGEKAKPEA